MKSATAVRLLGHIAQEGVVIVWRTLRSFTGGEKTRGAMTIVCNGAGEVLLVKAVYRRHWGFPGGWLEPGESPGEGAQREIREETGVVLKQAPTLVTTIAGKRHFGYMFAGIIDESAGVAATTAWEIGSTTWVRPENAVELHPICGRFLKETPGGLAAIVQATLADQSGA